jgi:hypothetical protein
MATKKSIKWYAKRAALYALIVLCSPLLDVCYVGGWLYGAVADEEDDDGDTVSREETE